MQIVSPGDNLHGMSKPIFGENEKKKSKFHLLKFLPSIPNIKYHQHMVKKNTWEASVSKTLSLFSEIAV